MGFDFRPHARCTVTTMPSKNQFEFVAYYIFVDTFCGESFDRFEAFCICIWYTMDDGITIWKIWVSEREIEHTRKCSRAEEKKKICKLRLDTYPMMHNANSISTWYFSIVQNNIQCLVFLSPSLECSEFSFQVFVNEFGWHSCHVRSLVFGSVAIYEYRCRLLNRAEMCHTFAMNRPFFHSYFGVGQMCCWWQDDVSSSNLIFSFHFQKRYESWFCLWCPQNYVKSNDALIAEGTMWNCNG